MFRKVYQVADVRLTILKTKPLTLRIIATGVVPTSGYSESELVRWIYIMPPADGVYSFDFVAKAPTGPVAEVLTPITVVHHWQPYPNNLKGIRVHASSNQLVVMLTKADSIAFQPQRGNRK